MSDFAALPDGLYLYLPEEPYFRQERLGSTDLVKLAKTPADWWYSSRHNPHRIALEESYELAFGSALHKLVLEGEHAFQRDILISPYNDFRTKDARQWRERQPPGVTILKSEAVHRVRHMAQLILNHPEWAGPLRQGVPEASVFFHHQGVAMRARLDYLLPQFTLDLKSFGGHIRGRDARDKALRIVAERSYDVQRYVYDVARQAMVQHIREGRVYWSPAEELRDPPPSTMAWLAQLAEEPEWSWVWVFYQRRDDIAGRAPIVMPIQAGPQDITWETGKEKTELALANYASFVRRFGLTTPWALVEPMFTPSHMEWPHWLREIGAVSADNDNTEEQELNHAV